MGDCAYRPRAHLVVADGLDFGQAGLDLLNRVMNNSDGSRARGGRRGGNTVRRTLD